MCSHCTSTETHNGLCDKCASLLRTELKQMQDLIAQNIYVDTRHYQIVKLSLADYDNPENVKYDDRLVTKYLNGSYNPSVWK